LRTLFWTDLYRELGYFERLTAIEEEWPGANILLHKGDGLPQVSNVVRIIFTYTLNS